MKRFVYYSGPHPKYHDRRYADKRCRVENAENGEYNNYKQYDTEEEMNRDRSQPAVKCKICAQNERKNKIKNPNF